MKSALRILGGLVVLIGFGWSAWHLVPMALPAVGRWLDVGEAPKRTDYVMSLPGDENYRPFVAAALTNLGLADWALIVQDEPALDVQDGVALPTSEITRRVYRYCGVAESKLVVLAGASGSTAGDMSVLAEFLQEHPAATVAIVTSDYHTRRANWTARRRLGKAAERMTILSAPNGQFDFDHWWRSEDGFLCVTTEYVKLAAYGFLYGWSAWWLGAGVAVILAWKFRRRHAQLLA